MASRWFKKPEIQEEIKRLKQELYTDILLDPNDIVQRYIDIAFLDSDELDGKAIKMSDSLRALEWLSSHLNMANEEQKLKIEVLKKQLNTNDQEDDGVEIINDAPI